MDETEEDLETDFELLKDLLFSCADEVYKNKGLKPTSQKWKDLTWRFIKAKVKIIQRPNLQGHEEFVHDYIEAKMFSKMDLEQKQSLVEELEADLEKETITF